MILHEFEIPIYKLPITMTIIESKNDWKEFHNLLKKMNLSKDVIDEERERILKEYVDGARTFFNFKYKKVLVVIYPHEDFLTMLGSIAHEKRHIEDDLAKQIDLVGDEAMAYLAGALAIEMYKPVISKTK